MTAIPTRPRVLPRRAPAAAAFLTDVLHGLGRKPKELPSKYFYDEAGSELFDQICDLEEYYLTRTELAIMRQHAAEMARMLGPRCALLEYGSGRGTKTRLLLDHLEKPTAYIPIDIARESLIQTARELTSEYPALAVYPVCADFTQAVEMPTVDTVADRRVVYFPGSTIGNFTPDEALYLLRQTARLCGPGGGLLLGADLKKEPRLLYRAYNDARGVTAAFNLNILRRVNRELAADFCIDRFWHHALYNPQAGRVEMHLVSQGDQRVHIGQETIDIAEGESIRTEYSHKYSLGDIRDMADAAGFSVQQIWTDSKRWFSVANLTVAS